LVHPWVSEPRASPPLGPDGRPALPHELDDHLPLADCKQLECAELAVVSHHVDQRSSSLSLC
jgi:hypothetical protein